MISEMGNPLASKRLKGSHDTLTFVPLLSYITFFGDLFGINSSVKNIWGLLSTPLPALVKATTVT